MRRWSAAAVLLAGFAARAQDRFEIQVYDTEVAGPGEVGVELHTNYAFSGVPASGVELGTGHVLHTTLEPHVGLLGWAELGAYLQGALQPGGTYEFAGAKLRFKARWPQKLLDGALGLAVNLELSRVPARYEANVWGSEVRPVIDLREGPLYLSVNPILGVDLQGPLAGKPQLEPAAKLSVFATPRISAGVEHYMGLGAVDALLPAAEQNHRLFGCVDVAADWFDLNVGFGHGFGSAEPWLAKVIIGLHPPGAPAEHVPPPRPTP